MRMHMTTREAKLVERALDDYARLPPPHLRRRRRPRDHPILSKLKRRLTSNESIQLEDGSSTATKSAFASGTLFQRKKQSAATTSTGGGGEHKQSVASSAASGGKKSWSHAFDDQGKEWKPDLSEATVSFSMFVQALKKACGAKAQVATEFRSSVIISRSVSRCAGTPCRCHVIVNGTVTFSFSYILIAVWFYHRDEWAWIPPWRGMDIPNICINRERMRRGEGMKCVRVCVGPTVGGTPPFVWITKDSLSLSLG